jgi:hypothetical protein
MVLIFFVANALAGEVTLSLDRCQVVNNSRDYSSPSKLIINFAFPRELLGNEIILAELTAVFSLQSGLRDSSMEFRFCPLLSQLPDGPIDYLALESVTDSMSAGSWICNIGERTTLRVPLTDFIREAALGERPNFGLVGCANLISDFHYRLPEAFGERFRSSARVRIEYK